MMVVVYFLWFYFICKCYVAPGENSKAKAWERVCKRQLLLDKLSTRIHKLFVLIPRIAPVGGMTMEVKSTLQPQVIVVCKWRLKFIVLVESEPNYNHSRSCV